PRGLIEGIPPARMRAAAVSRTRGRRSGAERLRPAAPRLREPHRHARHRAGIRVGVVEDGGEGAAALPCRYGSGSRQRAGLLQGPRWPLVVGWRVGPGDPGGRLRPGGRPTARSRPGATSPGDPPYAPPPPRLAQPPALPVPGDG